MKHRADLAFQQVAGAAATLVLALVALAALVFDVVAGGLGRLGWEFLTSMPRGGPRTRASTTPWPAASG